MARRIIFSAEKIEEIRKFIEVDKNTIASTANKFGISEDTVRRVMHENNIEVAHPEKRNKTVEPRQITPEKEAIIVKLYTTTDITIKDICMEVKLEDYMVQEVLRKNFTEEFINQRKSRIYRKSKLGDKNPMFGKRGEETHNWIGGVVEDGNGYLMVKKPEWYTGRARSDYIFQHSVVMCEALGLTAVPEGFAIHHIDRNTRNNDLNNLALVNMGAHTRLHNIERKMMVQGSETIRNGVGESRNA